MKLKLANRDKYIEELEEDYKYYIKNVSSRGMAASLESCTFLMYFCEITNPESVVDLGSGFSSFALRKYQKNHDPSLEVFSIDSDKEWLDKSSAFVGERNCSTENFLTWGEFESVSKTFNLVFFDIDKTHNRPSYLPIILDNFIDNTSYLILDDMHKKFLVSEYEKIFDTYDYEKLNIRKITKDGRGQKKRFCELYYNIRSK
jgi:predicted O-methyltransferase YrrM